MKSIHGITKSVVAKIKSKELEETMISFLSDNPNPSDSKVHDWAEKNDIAVDDAERAIYSLATKFVKILKGGKAGKKGLKPEDVDQKQLEIGTKIELEHTPDKDVARHIALDHLAEFGNYYDALIKMEKELESE